MYLFGYLCQVVFDFCPIFRLQHKMVEKILNGHNVIFYDSVEDLPIVQFHKYSKHILVESGIGDTIQDIDRHITRVINFLHDTKKAHQELLNLRQCIYLVATEQDLHNKATLCLVKSVDGKDWTDFSDSGIEGLYRLVNGASVREMEELASKVRDAIDENLLQYFPRIFEDATQKNYTDLLRRRAILQIQAIVKGENKDEEINSVTEQIYRMQNPKGFMGADSEEVRFDKQFEDMCLLMAKEFGGGIKKYSTMEFYTAFERLTRQYNEAKKIRNRRK